MTGIAGKRNYLGDVRRSQVIGYGPGAIIDFRSGARGGGPVSIVAGSLDGWNDTAEISGPDDPQLLFEPRLQKVLQKNHFRQPPVDESDPADDPERQLRGYRFPAWLVCPECNRLDYANRWGRTMGDAARWCEPCSERSGRRVFVVPTRFVTACVDGHLDEFPWHYWIRRAHLLDRGNLGNRPKCITKEEGRRSQCKFKLKNLGGSGLESLQLWCDECGAGAGLGEIFSKDALKGMTCSGREPWIEGDARIDCAGTPRAMQRGASNLYFPVTYSALSIPPWSGELFSELQSSWGALKRYSPEMQKENIEVYAQTYAGMHGMTPEEYAAHVRRLLEMEDELTADDIRPQEYAALKSERREENSVEFKAIKQRMPADMSDHFRTLVRVQRLREVRALVSFKRIHPHVDLSTPGVGKFGRLSTDDSRIDWLPAIEVRGEGIFIEFSREKIEAWIASQPEIVARISRLNEEYQAFLRRVTAQETVDFSVSVEQVLVHSFSHAFIKRLSFESGYDAASLRERIFVGNDPWMAGVLVYTSTTDADGTLGGLERQGLPDRMTNLVLGAIRDIDMCSSDPLCRRGVSSTSELLNLSACHNCLFLPETSCELGNRLLDRLILVGEEGTGETEMGFEGFFSEYLGG
jgi:hypothetical protein